jgi:hypothetical protein
MGMYAGTSPGSQFDRRFANPAPVQGYGGRNQREGTAMLLRHLVCLRGPRKQARQQMLPPTACSTLRSAQLNHDHSRALGHSRV